MANKIPRVPVREQDPQIRATNFEEVCYGYDLDEARLEASRCLHCRNPRCVAACPVSIRIPDFIGALHTGELQQAADIIAGDSSLPSICGRVCPQESQCEGSCILGIKGEPVAIGKLERFIGDWKLEHGAAAAQTAPRNGYKVAVIGSGPAGWPARATLRNWAMKSRSSRRCTRRAAYWSTASPSSGCPRSASWHAKSPRSKNWA